VTGTTSNRKKDQFDVVVVGAGPAGSTAARHCALGGLRTLLLEKEILPRYKPCAGGVTLAASRELDFVIPDSLIERQCRGVRVRFRDIEREVHLSVPVAFMVTRSSFDAYLAAKAEEAGATLRDHTPCTRVSVERDSAHVETGGETIRTKLVIGADGFFSCVRKSMHFRFEPEEIRFCVLADVPLPPEEIDRRFGDLVLIHYEYVSRGYAWMFPKRTHLSTGIGGAFDRPRELPDRLRDFLSRYGVPSRVPIRGCFIPVSRWKRNIFQDRLLLTGDAAGLVDSFSGEGIRFAITSGKQAAQTAIRAHEMGDFSPGLLQEYQDRLIRDVGRELQRSNRATDLLFNHMNLLLGTALRNEEALERYLMTMRGDSSFGDFVALLKRRMPRYLLRRLLHLR
jgi:geranylgeranyl reductase family protein